MTAQLLCKDQIDLSDTCSWGNFLFSLSKDPSVAGLAVDLVFTLSSLSHFAFQFAPLLSVLEKKIMFIDCRTQSSVRQHCTITHQYDIDNIC